MIGSRKARSWLSLLLSGSALLAGCDMVVLRPSGYVAAQQGHLVVMSTLLMLLIIVPVIVLTLVFAWRYRASNTAARYTPDWDHSVQLELLIWAAPLLIIILLGALTWIGTHTLDPYRPLTRIDAVAAPSWRDRTFGRRSRRPRLEMAVHLSRPGHRGRQRVGGAGGRADPLQDHGVVRDELVFHSGSGRSDLCDAEHGDQVTRGYQPAGRVRGLFRQLQRRRLLRHALQVPRDEQCRLRPLGAEGKGGGHRTESQTTICNSRSRASASRSAAIRPSRATCSTPS